MRQERNTVLHVLESIRQFHEPVTLAINPVFCAAGTGAHSDAFL
jgi:hypothetical protein